MKAGGQATDLGEFARRLQELGREARAKRGASDVRYIGNLLRLSRAAEICGRLILQFAPNPLGWIVGTTSLTFHLAMDSQLMHAIQHGAYVGLPGAEKLTPECFDTLALPLQSQTWGKAHAIHHRTPSLPGEDPDTIHALYRVHPSAPRRWWHRFNTLLPQLILFEHCAFTYDRFLKQEGLRPKNDRSELMKFTAFVLYQYVFFSVMAGTHWKQVLAAGVVANLVRNLIFSGLQMGSSIGHSVSLDHDRNSGDKGPGEWCHFQVETSKNWVAPDFWKPVLGGLDRHIEHHLYSNLPPHRLHALSGHVRELCRKHGVKYHEHPSFLSTIHDSLSYLRKLS